MSNWLTGVIVLLIIIILIDGYRRRNKNRIDVSPALKKSLRNNSQDVADDEAPSYLSELPNGGARVVGVRDPAQPVSHKKLSARELKEQRRREELANRTPEQARLNLDESVPILMESVEQVDARTDEHGRIEPSFSAQDDYDQEPEAPEQDKGSYEDDESDYDEDYDDSFDENEDLEDDYLEDDYEEDFEDDYEEENDEEEIEPQETKAAAPQAEPEEVLIINIMAPKGDMFNGSELLDIVLKCGLRYGSMDIFHRYSDTKGAGALLFSMANMVRPGTFDLDAMDEFATPGVSLFMTLPIDADSMQSFDLMVETAQAISQTLGGELKDEQRSAMTRQTLEHCRQRISDFERKKLFRRPR